MKQVKKDKKKQGKRRLIVQIIHAILLLIILLISFRCGRSNAPAGGEYEKNVNAALIIGSGRKEEEIDVDS